MSKRVTIFVLCVVSSLFCVFSFYGCGGGGDSSNPELPISGVVFILPKQVTYPGESITLTAVTGRNDVNYTWSATGGRISGSGASVVWTAPTNKGGIFTLTVTASNSSSQKTYSGNLEVSKYVFKRKIDNIRATEIALDKNGLYTADRGDTKVYKYDTHGNLQSSFDTIVPTTNGGQKYVSIGRLAIDSEGYIYVSSGLLVKYDAMGQYINSMRACTSSDLIFAVDRSTNFVYGLCGNLNLMAIGTLTSSGWSQQASSVRVSCFKAGFTISTYNFAVDKGSILCPGNGFYFHSYDSNGGEIWRASTSIPVPQPDGHGSPYDNYAYFPYRIAADSSGNIFVVSFAGTATYTVLKYDSAGNYMTRWGREGSGDGQFNDAEGIAIDSSGDVYVMDSGNKRIQVFSPMQ